MFKVYSAEERQAWKHTTVIRYVGLHLYGLVFVVASGVILAAASARPASNRLAH